MMTTQDRAGLVEHLEIECNNLCDFLEVELGVTYNDSPSLSVRTVISNEEGQLTVKEWLENLEYVHNEIAASIKRYKESLNG